MSDATQCPDCDSVKVSIFVNEGNGQCSVCHGDGLGSVMNQISDGINPFTDEKTPCWKCNGSGQCQTCGGSGVV